MPNHKILNVKHVNIYDLTVFCIQTSKPNKNSKIVSLVETPGRVLVENGPLHESEMHILVSFDQDFAKISSPLRLHVSLHPRKSLESESRASDQHNIIS